MSNLATTFYFKVVELQKEMRSRHETSKHKQIPTRPQHFILKLLNYKKGYVHVMRQANTNRFQPGEILNNSEIKGTTSSGKTRGLNLNYLQNEEMRTAMVAT